MAVARTIFGSALCLLAVAASTSAATVPSWRTDFTSAEATATTFFENAQGCCRLSDKSQGENTASTSSGKIKVPKKTVIKLEDAFKPSEYITNCTASCSNGCIGAELQAHTWYNKKTKVTEVTAFTCITFNDALSATVAATSLKGQLCKTTQCLRWTTVTLTGPPTPAPTPFPTPPPLPTPGPTPEMVGFDWDVDTGKSAQWLDQDNWLNGDLGFERERGCCRSSATITNTTEKMLVADVVADMARALNGDAAATDKELLKWFSETGHDDDYYQNLADQYPFEFDNNAFNSDSYVSWLLLSRCTDTCDITVDGCVGTEVQLHTWKNKKANRVELKAYSCKNFYYNTTEIDLLLNQQGLVVSGRSQLADYFVAYNGVGLIEDKTKTSNNKCKKRSMCHRFSISNGPPTPAPTPGPTPSPTLPSPTPGPTPDLAGFEWNVQSNRDVGFYGGYDGTDDEFGVPVGFESKMGCCITSGTVSDTSGKVLASETWETIEVDRYFEQDDDGYFTKQTVLLKDAFPELKESSEFNGLTAAMHDRYAAGDYNGVVADQCECVFRDGCVAKEVEAKTWTNPETKETELKGWKCTLHMPKKFNTTFIDGTYLEYDKNADILKDYLSGNLDLVADETNTKNKRCRERTMCSRYSQQGRTPGPTPSPVTPNPTPAPTPAPTLPTPAGFQWNVDVRTLDDSGGTSVKAIEHKQGCCKSSAPNKVTQKKQPVKDLFPNEKLFAADAFDESNPIAAKFLKKCRSSCDYEDGCVGAEVEAHVWRKNKNSKLEVTAYSCDYYNLNLNKTTIDDYYSNGGDMIADSTKENNKKCQNHVQCNRWTDVKV